MPNVTGFYAPMTIRRLVQVYQALALPHPQINDFQASEIWMDNDSASLKVPVMFFEYPILVNDVIGATGSGMREYRYSFQLLDRIIEAPGTNNNVTPLVPTEQELMRISALDIIACEVQQTFINQIANRYNFVITGHAGTTIHRHDNRKLYGVRYEVTANSPNPFNACSSPYPDIFPDIEDILECS